jgi:hypothetical protein
MGGCESVREEVIGQGKHQEKTRNSPDLLFTRFFNIVVMLYRYRN